jgi:hypothetical protein
MNLLEIGHNIINFSSALNTRFFIVSKIVLMLNILPIFIITGARAFWKQVRSA